MKLTEALKAHLSKKFGIPADADEAAFKKCVQEKLATDELSADELIEHSQSPQAAKSKIDELLAKFDERIDAKLAKMAEKQAHDKDQDAAVNERLSAMEKDLDDKIGARLKALDSDPDRITPARLFGAAGKERVKTVAELYSTTKSAAICPQKRKDGSCTNHPQAGQPATFNGRALDHPSQLDKAVAGAFWKMRVNQSWPNNADMPSNLRMTQHDWDLVAYAAHEMPWTGLTGSEDDPATVEIAERKLTDSELKGFTKAPILDDGSAVVLGGSSTSGGSAIVPLVFDDAIVITPILNGELFPLVDLKILPRGRRITGAGIANPTINSGPAENTPITLETTTNFVSEIDTNVFNATGAFELGMDFVEDTPVDIANVILRQYGEALAGWLDNQIANGDGTTEPLGIFVASGTTSVASVNGASGPLTVGDIEALSFAVPKATRANGRMIFVANDTTYRRVRATPTGADDARRVFGMDHMSYTVLDRPFKVQNDIADGLLGHVNMAYYRMWRRRGLTVRVETQGQTLALKNTQLIVVRARYGGRPVLGSAFAVMADAAASDHG